MANLYQTRITADAGGGPILRSDAACDPITTVSVAEGPGHGELRLLP